MTEPRIPLDSKLRLPDDIQHIADAIPAGSNIGELRRLIGLLPLPIAPGFPNPGGQQAAGEDPALAAQQLMYSNMMSGFGSMPGSMIGDGTVDGGAITPGSLDPAAFASTINPVLLVDGPANPALPDATYPVNIIIYNKSTGLLYKNVANAWQPVVQAIDLAGQITNAQITDGTIAGTKFASGLQPIYIAAADPALPDALYPVGSTFYNTTSKLLKKNVANVWTNIVNATDLSGQIATGQIAANAVGTAQLAANAVTANELAANAVTSGKINANAVIAGKIAAGTISATELAANSVVAGKIAAGTIVANDIAAGAITTAKLAAGAVTANEIAANTITAGQIQAGAISTTELAANAVTAAKIAALTITAAQIAANTITAAKIAAGTITATELAANSIIAGKIAAGAVSTTELAANAVTAAKIGAGEITTVKLVVNGIDIGAIATANSITNASIATDAIDARTIVAGAITATDITTGTLTGITITGNSITAGSNGNDGFAVTDGSGASQGSWTSGGIVCIGILASGAVIAGTLGVGTKTAAGTGGVSTYNGELFIDTASGTFGRFYAYHSSGWHYVAFTAGFLVPVHETLCPSCGLPLEPGQDLIGGGDRYEPDGALHGLWKHMSCAGRPFGPLADAYATSRTDDEINALIDRAGRKRGVTLPQRTQGPPLSLDSRGQLPLIGDHPTLGKPDPNAIVDANLTSRSDR